MHAEQSVFVSGLYLHGSSGKVHMGSITDAEYDKRYTSHWMLNNYSSNEQKVTIRLYNRRQPFENHHTIDLDETSTWTDKVGEATHILPAYSASKVAVPFQVTKRHPSVNRYLPYICGTITYHSPNSNGLEIGREYPLLSDGNIVYRKSSKDKNPNPFLNVSWVNNRAIVSLK